MERRVNDVLNKMVAIMYEYVMLQCNYSGLNSAPRWGLAESPRWGPKAPRRGLHARKPAARSLDAPAEPYMVLLISDYCRTELCFCIGCMFYEWSG